MGKITKLLIALVSFGLANAAWAGTSSASAKATATMSSTCVVSAGNVVFGTYNPTNTAFTLGTETMVVVCTKGTAYTIHNNVANYGVVSSQPVGIMSDGNGNTLNFQQYIPTISAWAADDTNTDTANYYTHSTGTGVAQSFAYNYRILPNQYVSPANYSVNETVTLSF